MLTGMETDKDSPLKTKNSILNLPGINTDKISNFVSYSHNIT